MMRVVTTLAFMLVILSAQQAVADRLFIWSWGPSELINYKIHSDYRIPGAREAIMNASYTWFNDSNVAVRLNFTGLTNDSSWPSNTSQCPAGLENKVVIVHSQSPGGPNILAETFEGCCDSAGRNCRRFLIETYNHSGISWATTIPSSTQYDLYGNMVHEFGHALDLKHPPPVLCYRNSVMCVGRLRPGATLWRNLFPQDQLWVHQMYNTRARKLYYSETSNDLSWSSATAVDNSKNVTSGTASAFGWLLPFYPYLGIGWAGAQYNNRVNAINQVDLTRHHVFSMDSHTSPAMVYDPEGLRHYIVWSSCDTSVWSQPYQLHIASSTDGFNTLECGQEFGPLRYEDATNSFNISAYENPALAYDPYSQRIFLVWSHYDPECSKADAVAGSGTCQTFQKGGVGYKLYDGQILMASFPTGTSCSPLVTSLVDYQFDDTGVAGPAMACSSDTTYRNCIMTVPGTDGLNSIFSISFGFNTDGTLWSKGASLKTPYNDASQTHLGICEYDGTFVIGWRGIEGNLADISRRLNVYQMTLNGGVIQFLNKRTLGMRTSNGLSMTAIAGGTKAMVWAN